MSILLCIFESPQVLCYAEPDVEIMSKVKDEKLFRAEARKVLKAKKYGDAKEAVEDLAFGGSV